VCQREDDGVVADDLLRKREREAEHGNTPIAAVFPLRSRLGKLADHGEHRIDLVLS
jgi:hypothetical protein